MSASGAIYPGSIIGVMGSGQLGRMLAIAAKRLGYRVHTYSAESDTPTGQVADFEAVGPYDDEQAVRAFARGLDVLTFEFENIPALTVEWASEECPVRPSGNALHICQHRLREKTFLRDAGLPVAAFQSVSDEAGLRSAVRDLGVPSVLKTAAFGYDGKGQRKIGPEADLAAVWSGFNQLAVLEAWVPFERELSVIIARGMEGSTEVFPVCENVHSNHILDVTLVPARIPDAVARDARRIAETVVRALDFVGVLAVELFQLADGSLLVNELAPRTHNSGHFSFDACVTSQFEQQLRAVCGLPLGSTRLLRPVAMANLLGDVWESGEPDWISALSLPEVKLHLYGKVQPRAARKMGHLVAFGDTVEAAADLVREARSRLVRAGSPASSTFPGSGL
jgi:5-(carboxyamino)imidazole ribonucleotide synthase